MPDMQMCRGELFDAELETSQVCNIRETCYRYKAKPSMYQAFGPPAKDFTSEEGCENFISD
jgi:hypothetical protein